MTRALRCVAVACALALPVPGQAFSDSFTGLAPAAPTPFVSPHWHVAVHSRDHTTWAALEPMPANHGPTCSPPPGTHTVTAPEDVVYNCANHTMTAINASGYGVVYLTPDAMADFRDGEAIVRVDVSTFRASTRDWWDIYVTPFEDNLQLPLESWLPDLQGQPRRAVHVRMDVFNGHSRFLGAVIDDYVTTPLNSWWVGYETWLSPSPTQRQTFELRISRTRVRFGMPAFGMWWVDEVIPDLGWDRGVVQFGHHSYNPQKPGTTCPNGHDPSLAGLTCPSPNTWHWDDVEISPAVRFSMIKADRRAVSSNDTDRTFALDRPAPADAFVRFAAIGVVSVSFDGGAFTPATVQAGELQASGQHDPGHFASYWMPIPEGTETITFDLQPEGWWTFERRVHDLAVWSLVTAGAGCAGTGGVVPSISHPAPVLGDPGFGIGLANALPGTPAMLGLSQREVAHASPCGLFISTAPTDLLLPSAAAFGIETTSPTGSANVSLPLPADPTLSGLVLYAQWVVIDPAGQHTELGTPLALTPMRRLLLQ